MKKIIFALTLLTMSIAAIAKPTNADRELLRNLSNEFKNSAQVKWTYNVNYNKAAFIFNGQSISAFYSTDNMELIGYFMYEQNPAVIARSIQKNYSGYTLIASGKFIDAHGDINYFAQVTNKKSTLVLKITPKGSISIFSKVY